MLRKEIAKSMYDQDKILNIIFKCAEELNFQLPIDGQLELNGSTPIIGNDSVLDSLGIVTLLVKVEVELSNLGKNINLVDTLTHDPNSPPFGTMQDLSVWINRSFFK